MFYIYVHSFDNFHLNLVFCEYFLPNCTGILKRAKNLKSDEYCGNCGRKRKTLIM